MDHGMLDRGRQKVRSTCTVNVGHTRSSDAASAFIFQVRYFRCCKTSWFNGKLAVHRRGELINVEQYSVSSCCSWSSHYLGTKNTSTTIRSSLVAVLCSVRSLKFYYSRLPVHRQRGRYVDLIFLYFIPLTETWHMMVMVRNMFQVVIFLYFYSAYLWLIGKESFPQSSLEAPENELS